jgi:hypothetical protein
VSFIGRARVRVPDNGNPPTPPTRDRLAPLNHMTGSRIAASHNGVVRWVESESDRGRRGPRLADIFAKIYRPGEGRPCTRCGRPEHIDWGHEYERLVCDKVTLA